MNLNGTVASLPNAAGNLTVKMGILNSKVNIRDLEIIDEPDIKAPGLTRGSTGKIKMNKSMNIKTEINLIGKTVDEAISQLDKYLDDAYIAHLPQVYVIHGKGTGALRNAVQNHLKKCSYVKSYRTGEHGEGGAGATVVEFKQIFLTGGFKMANKQKILIVDDDENIANLISLYLTKECYETRFSSGGICGYTRR